jgi:rhamnosyltransferase
MNNPKILVLMATYNGEAWVAAQLESILAQQGVEVSILVRDDASTDGTLNVLNDFAEKDARISVHVATESSGAAGRSFRRLFCLADEDGFDAVALADQDDVWYPDKLMRAMRALRDSGADAYSCAVLAQWPSGRTKELTQRSRVRPLDFLFEAAGQGCTYVVRARAFQQIHEACSMYANLLDRLHYHDWLIFVLLRSLGKQWYFDEKPCMMYRQHQNNDLGSRGTLKAVMKRLSLIRSGWYREQIDAALRIAQTFAPEHALLIRFQRLFDAKPSIKRRVGLASVFLRFGRRRLTDRCVMVMCSLLGWV